MARYQMAGGGGGWHAWPLRVALSVALLLLLLEVASVVQPGSNGSMVGSPLQTSGVNASGGSLASGLSVVLPGGGSAAGAAAAVAGGGAKDPRQKIPKILHK